MQLFALKRNVILKDASAYNIQFFNGQPTFIDLLSFKLYQPGDFGLGNGSLANNSWFSLCILNWEYRIKTGIVDRTTASQLHTSCRCYALGLFFIEGMVDAYSPRELQNSAFAHQKKGSFSKGKIVFKRSLCLLLHNCVPGLEACRLPSQRKVLGAIMQVKTHALRKRSQKSYRQSFRRKNNINSVLDLGCNTGDYSFEALAAGALLLLVLIAIILR